MNRTPLVTRADDAGGSQSGNRAILECLQAGVLKNFAVMVCPPAFEDFVARYHDALSSLPAHDVGLHVTMNAEWFNPRWGSVLGPGEVPSLLDEHGHFYPSPQVTPAPKLEEGLREAAAQLRTLRGAGIEPQYLDTHMFFVGAWGWLDAFGEFADREGLIFAERFTYLEVPGTWNAPLTFDRLEQALQAQPGTSVFVTHPAYDDAEVQGMNSSDLPDHVNAKWRDADRQLMCDPALPDLLERFGRVPVRYSEVHD